MPDAAAHTRGTARGVPLSPPQQTALLTERLYGAPSRNLAVAIEICGPLDIDRLRRAWTAVLSDHEILRGVYPRERRVPYQQVVAVPPDALAVTPLDPADLETRLDTDAGHRFDLEQQIPVRAWLYTMADRHVLSLVVHPVAADDTGLDLVVRALITRYAGDHGNTVQYRDFVSRQLKALAADPATDPDLRHWTQHLAELPRAPRVWAHADTAVTMTRRDVVVDATTTSALLNLVPDADPAAVVAALVAVRSATSGDLPIGLVDEARADAEQVIGNFANHLVLRLAPPGGRTVRDVLGEAVRVVAEARSHTGSRIERLAHLLRGTAAYHGDALFTVLIRHRPPGRSAEVPGWREVRRRGAHPVGIDLVVDAAVTAAGMRIEVQFPAELAGRPDIEALVQGLGPQCRDWAAHPDAVVAEPPPVGIASGPAEFGDGDALRGLGGAPSTDTERLLADLIWEVLELDGEPIGREDTFFALGGDSITALRLATVLGDRGYPVEVRTIFGHPAVHDLAGELEQAVPAPAEPTDFAPLSASGLDETALRALGGGFAAHHARH